MVTFPQFLILLAALPAPPASCEYVVVAARDLQSLTLPAHRPLPARQRPVTAKYAVLVDPGKNSEFLPAAKALAKFHNASLQQFDADKLQPAFTQLKKQQPKFVVFVLPPEKIDVDLTHQILECSTKIDGDPFCDFEYGFITGKDGKAALRFVERIKKAWKRTYGRKVAMFGSWEGQTLPQQTKMSALEAMKAEGVANYVLARDKAPSRKKAARNGLAKSQKRDALLFFSHGYPNEMAACFNASDFRNWKIDLAPSILVNCACYNGAPGRWFAPGRAGPVDRGIVERKDSVALEILDSGIAGYFAGVDPWHGPLAFQVFGHIFDDGLRLGQAANMMHNRLALEFLPKRIHFPLTRNHPKRFSGEGVNNRRHNGGGMIYYGDPAFAPFAKSASRLRYAEMKNANNGEFTVRLGTKPLVKGQPSQDYMLPMNMLIDYYSIRSAKDFLKQLKLEIYRVVPLPKGAEKVTAVRVQSAQNGKRNVPTKTPQVVIEKTPHGNYLHVRVPLDAQAFGTFWPMNISREGIAIEVEGQIAK